MNLLAHFFHHCLYVQQIRLVHTHEGMHAHMHLHELRCVDTKMYRYIPTCMHTDREALVHSYKFHHACMPAYANQFYMCADIGSM